MSAVEDFIYGYEGEQQRLLLYFHRLLCSLELRPKIRYKIPFYYGKSWICYLNPIKKGGLEFALTRGNELSNVQGLLRAKGRKQVRSIEFAGINDIPKESIREIIMEAILLDEQVPYKSPAGKKAKG